MSMWAPFSVQAQRLMKDAGDRNGKDPSDADPVAILNEIFTSQDAGVRALLAQLSLPPDGEKLNAAIAELKQSPAAHSKRLRATLDAAIHRSSSRPNANVSHADLLFALLKEPEIAAALRKAGVDVDRALKQIAELDSRPRGVE
jgi:ATP-dependent Clp protease ATP-binding subunit ClpA